MENKYVHFGIEFDTNITPKHMTKENFVNKELEINKYLTEYAKNEALKNYNLNINYFTNLSQKDFNQAVKNLLKIYDFIQIYDLNTLKNKKGIYILILDKYKQLYIGQSSRDLKQRILRHFKITIPYQKVPIIKPDTLPIDSFKPLDITRIYALYVPQQITIDEIESKLIKQCPNNYILNKIIGGKPNNLADLLTRLGTGRIKKSLTIHDSRIKLIPKS